MNAPQFKAGYSDLSLRPLGPLSRISGSAHPILVAHFRLKSDIGSLLPYINAVAEGATLYDRPAYVRFSLKGVLCGLHPDEGAAGLFEDSLQAHDFAHELMGFLNHIHRHRNEIRPDPRGRNQVPVLEIFKLLPRRNCGQCGYPSCLAFAAAISRQDADPAECASLQQPLRQSAEYPVYNAEGKIERTIAIEVDMMKMRHVLRENRERIAKLEAEVARLARTERSSGSSGTQGLPVSLTEREMQVLALLTRGASNTKISELLLISRHTVKSHVIHIFNKLGVGSRTEAAVWAARHGIV